MSKEAVLAFRNKVLESTDLQDQVRAALKSGGSPALVPLGQTNGHEFTVDDLKQVYAPVESGELTESQLEGVAGGANNANPLSAFEMQMVTGGGNIGAGIHSAASGIGSAIGGAAGAVGGAVRGGK